MARIIYAGHSALDQVFTVDAWPQTSAKMRANSLVEAGGGMAETARDSGTQERFFLRISQ